MGERAAYHGLPANLTSQMEALRRPDHLDQSIASFREELAEIELARENETAARPWFAKAYAALSAEPWLQANEPARLERLRQRGGVQ